MRNFQQIVKDVSNLKWSTVVLEEAFAEVEDNVKLQYAKQILISSG